MKRFKLFFILAVFFFAANYLSAKAINAYPYYLSDKSEVNSFDSLFIRPYNKSLDFAGTVASYMAIATTASLLVAPKEDYWKIGVVGLETLGSAFAIRSILKHSIDRERPYMYFSGAPTDKIADGDYLNSFPSGHTTLAFAAAGFTTFMFCHYYPNSKMKIPAICTSYALAVGTGILRMSSGNHFATDVLAGAAIGTACGFLVPLVNTLWFKNDNKIQLSGGLTGLYCTVKF